MKSKVIAAVTNLVICAVIIVTALVGFYGGKAAAVADADNVYYGSQSEDEVCLMFNVYQNTGCVRDIVELLETYEAKATFFMGGCWADDNTDCVREVYAAGHEIASHGYFHKDHSKLGYEANLSEISTSVRLLEALCGADVRLFAPPSGAFGEYTVSACSKLGLDLVMWSKDTIDWRDSDPDVIFSRATDGLEGGDFILMHPTEGTVKALPRILGYIRNAGLTCTTVSHALGE